MAKDPGPARGPIHAAGQEERQQSLVTCSPAPNWEVRQGHSGQIMACPKTERFCPRERDLAPDGKPPLVIDSFLK